MLKVLIVDDEVNARLYLANILHELYPEFEILMAKTPVEALFILIKQKIDIMLLDVEMPGMTGLEFANDLRDQLNDIPVIFVSAYKRAEFIQKALRLNAVDYIDKPVNPKELEFAVQKACDFKELSAKSKIIDGRLKLFTEQGEMFFEPNEILYFESVKRNSIAHFSNGFSEVIVRQNIKSLANLLPNEIYKHVSRKYIVNISFVKFISKSNHTITISDGTNKILLSKIFPQFFYSKLK